jgi:hypothetical protein
MVMFEAAVVIEVGSDQVVDHELEARVAHDRQQWKASRASRAHSDGSGPTPMLGVQRVIAFGWPNPRRWVKRADGSDAKIGR